MSTVDNRVVEMQFDDADFTPGIKQAIDALGKLQQALKLDVPSNGLSAISSNTIAVSGAFEGLQYTVTKTASTFNTLEVIALTALTNIVNRTVDAGLRIAKSLTIDQATQGFGEYELKMNSIQTIMAGTGEDLETVNGLLEKLNHYADKTIYSFSDMTANIGKFTNAGVELETAVDAIQGVSNLAALSGANASEASRAMYNFAQALSAGYVKLIDWKSIENANMATVEFKNQLLETALALGTVRKEGDMYVTTTTNANGAVSAAFDATHNFNDALSNQWMTTKVLTTTLARYVDETTEIGKKASKAATEVRTWKILVDSLKESIGSGWARSFELIFGDYHESTRFWTDLSETIQSIIGPIGDFRNSVLETWRTTTRWGTTGREQLLNGFLLRLKTAALALSPVIDALMKSLDMENLGKGLENLTSKFYKDAIEAYRYFTDDWVWGNMSQSATGYVRYHVEGLRNSMQLIFNDIKRVLSGITSILQKVSMAFFQVFHDENGAKLVGVLYRIHWAIINLSTALVPTEANLLDIFTVSKNVFGTIGNMFNGLINLVRFFTTLLAPIINAFKEVMGVNKVLTEVTDPIHALSQDFLAFTETLKLDQSMIDKIKETFVTVFQSIHDVVSSVLSVFSSLYENVRASIPMLSEKLSPILSTIASVFSTVYYSIKSAIPIIGAKLSPVISKVIHIFKTFTTVIFGAVGGIGLLISKLDFKSIASKFSSRIQAIREWLGQLYEKFKSNENISHFLELIGQAQEYISDLIETVKNTGSFESFKHVIDDVSEAFRNLQNESGFIGGAARALQTAIDIVSSVIANVQAKIASIKAIFDEVGLTESVSKMLQGIIDLDPGTFSEGFARFGSGLFVLIKDYIIPSIVDGVGAAIDSINTFLASPDGMQSVLNTVKSFFSLDALEQTFSDLGPNIDGLSLWNGASGLANKLVSGFLQIFGMPEEIANEALTNFFWFMSGFADPFAHIINTFTYQFANVVGEGSVVMSDALRSLLESMGAEIIDNPDQAFLKMLEIIRNLEIDALLGSLTKFFYSLGAIVDSFRGIPKQIGNMFKGIGQAFRGLGRFFTGAAVMEVAVGIWIVAQALAKIAEIDPDKLQRALEVLGMIAAGLAIFVLVMSAFSGSVDVAVTGDKTIDALKDLVKGFAQGLKGLNIAGIGIAVFAIAGAIWVIVQTVSNIVDLLDTVDIERLKIAAMAIAGALVGFGIILGAVAKLSTGSGGAALGNGLAILALAFAIKIIVSAISELVPLLDEPNIGPAAGIIAAFAVGLALIMIALSKVTEVAKGGFGTFFGIGLAMVLLAASMHIMVDALASLVEIIDNPAAPFAAFMLISFIAALGIVIAIIAGSLPAIANGFGTFFGIALAFIALSVSLHIIIEALKALMPLVNEQGFIGALISLGVLMIALAGAVFIVAAAAGMFKPKIGAMFGLSIALVAAGAAMWLIAQGVAAIAESSPSPELISTIMDKLAQMIIVLSLIVGLAGTMGPEFGFSGMVFATGMIEMSVAMLILAAAVAILADVPIDTLEAVFTKLTEALVVFLISAGIVAAIPPMEAALLVLGTALLEAGTGVAAFGAGAKDIADAMIKIQRIHEGAFDGVIDGLKKFLDAFAPWDAVNATNVANGLGKIVEKLDAFVDVLVRLKDSGIYSTSFALERIFAALDSYQGVGDLSSFQSFMETIAEHQSAMDSFSAYMDSSTAMVGHIGDTIPRLVESEQLFVDIEGGFIAALNHVADGLADFKNKTTGVSGVMMDVTASMKNLVGVMAGIIENNADAVNPAGAALVNALAAGIEDASPRAETSMANVADNIRYAAETDVIATRYENAGKRLIAAFMDGMGSQNVHVKDKAAELVQQAISGMDGTYRKFHDIGIQAVSGFANGLGDSGWAQRVYDAAYNMALNAPKGAQAALDENSPSKVFMRIGRYVSEGLAIGITDNGDLAEKAAFRMANSLSMIAQDAIDDINASKYDVYLNPVIDDSSLNSLTTGLMFNGFNLNGVNASIAALNQNGTANADLLAELQRVHRDLIDVASRPRTEINMGDINTYDDQAVQDATKSYITRLATLKGGM